VGDRVAVHGTVDATGTTVVTSLFAAGPRAAAPTPPTASPKPTHEPTASPEPTDDPLPRVIAQRLFEDLDGSRRLLSTAVDGRVVLPRY
jgi:hypothetical protein